MKGFAKLCLISCCVLSSIPVFASYKGEAPPLVPVSIPMFNGGFEFTVGAIYMEPDSSNGSFLGANYRNIASEGPNAIYNRTDYGVDPDYQWGFLLGLGYVVPGTANDIKLDWMSFHNDYSDSEYLLGSRTDAIFFPMGRTALNGFANLNATGKMDYKFDAVDLTFGQYVNFGSRLQARLFAGLRYMRLDSDLSTTYSYYNNEPISTGTQFLGSWNSSIDSSFNGLGPMVGLKADYYLGSGFSLTGGFDGALLVGQVDMSGSATQLNQSFNAGVWTVANQDTGNFSWDNQNVIAPGFDAKFGLSYKYQFNNGTLLGFELGYQATKYIDVIGEVDRGDTFEADQFDSDITNFRLSGMYLTMNVKI